MDGLYVNLIELAYKHSVCCRYCYFKANFASSVVLDYDFSAAVAAWPATCVTTPMIGATTSACQCVPIELLYVKAEEKGATNLLTWATASEFDNSHFELERSSDGQKFEPIEKIDGAGTTVEEQRYELVDAKDKY